MARSLSGAQIAACLLILTLVLTNPVFCLIHCNSVKQLHGELHHEGAESNFLCRFFDSDQPSAALAENVIPSPSLGDAGEGNGLVLPSASGYDILALALALLLPLLTGPLRWQHMAAHPPGRCDIPPAPPPRLA